jgi:arylsulfatase A-like enzyme
MTTNDKKLLDMKSTLVFLAMFSSTLLATDRPNVLVIMCDQLNANVLSCYGGDVPTLNIDRLAREGVRLNNAVCTTPFCSPSRASLVTGQYPHTHGIVYNVNRRDYPTYDSPPKQEGIKASDITTEKLLHAAGYSTHQYGKWHLTDDDLPCYNDVYGEHHEYAREMATTFADVRKRDADTWMNWYDWALPTERSVPFLKAVESVKDRWPKDKLAEFVTKMGRLQLPLSQNFDVRVADKTIERITALRDRPFMITCSFNAPHDPNVVPSPYYEMFDPAKIKLPANRNVIESRFAKDWGRQVVADLGEPGLREFLRIYYASIKLVDDQVGRVLKALESSGQLDRTIIVFTADHGDMAGGHGMVWKSTGAFYDEIVRIPLLVRYPRAFKPQRCDLAADLTDIMPTLLELTGQPIPPSVEGQSFVPYLTGRRDPSQARRYSFCERIIGNKENTRKLSPSPKGSFAVRGQGWKYIRYVDGTEFLYHLAADPGETVNEASNPAHQSRKQEMIAALKAWQHQTRGSSTQ